MKLIIFFILFFTIMISGCSNRYVDPPPPIPSPTITQITQIINTNLTQFPVTQQNKTNHTPVSPIVMSTYNLSISTSDITNANLSLLIEFSVNGSATLICNDTKYNPIDTTLVKNNNITIYYFIVPCAPRSYGKLNIAGYDINFPIPELSHTWSVKLNKI